MINIDLNLATLPANENILEQYVYIVHYPHNHCYYSIQFTLVRPS